MLLYFAVFLLVSTTSALDVTVGKTDCVGCPHYYKAGTDAFTALQTALEDVRKAGGGKVTIQAGEYILSKNFEVHSNTQLVGAGMDDTVLKLKNRASPWRVGTSSRSGFLRAVYKNYNNCENILVSDLTLDGNKANQNTDADSKYGRYGYFTEGCTNLHVENVKIRNFQGYGFDPHGWKSAPGGPLYGKGLTIVNCVSHDNDWDGFTLDQTDGMVVSNCYAYNNGRHGFNVVTGSRNVVIDNVKTFKNGFYYYTGASGCGMTIQNNQNFGTNSVTVKNSNFDGDKRGGMCTNGVYNIVFDKNKISTQPACFRLENTWDISVTNNVCNHTNIIRQITVRNLTTFNNTVSTTSTTCSSGIQNNLVCCLGNCVNPTTGQPQCGGTGCGSLPGGPSNCCQTQILASGRSCANHPPPCIL